MESIFKDTVIPILTGKTNEIILDISYIIRNQWTKMRDCFWRFMIQTKFFAMVCGFVVALYVRLFYIESNYMKYHPIHPILHIYSFKSNHIKTNNNNNNNNNNNVIYNSFLFNITSSIYILLYHTILLYYTIYD